MLDEKFDPDQIFIYHDFPPSNTLWYDVLNISGLSLVKYFLMFFPNYDMSKGNRYINKRLFSVFFN